MRRRRPGSLLTSTLLNAYIPIRGFLIEPFVGAEAAYARLQTVAAADAYLAETEHLMTQALQ